MNAIELELFRHLMVSIAEEMGVVLRKTSYSANIKERRDYSCAVYDAHGETVAMGDHMPVHLGAMPLSVRAVMDAFDLGPGDVALVNDPFRGGTHLPDITAVAPVFIKHSRKPAFYLANRAHHADVGGMSPGSMPLAREIYQEGIRLPPILIQRAGAIDGDLLRMILANVRTPEEREGDLRAQLMSIKRGEVRLHELVTKYGAPRVAKNMRALQDYSERMMRAAIAKLRPGIYKFEDCLDSDGITLRRPGVDSRRTITIDADSATVDFTGSDPQAAGPVNANYAVALAATMYVFRCLVEEEIPYTAGILRPIRVIAPEGTVVAARAPSAMAAGNVETSQRITDTVLGAMAKAAPDRIPAASSGTMNNHRLRRRGERQSVRLLRNHRRRNGRIAARRWIQRHAHAHDQQLEHAYRGVRAPVSSAHRKLPHPQRLRRRGQASRRRRHRARVPISGRRGSYDPFRSTRARSLWPERRQTRQTRKKHVIPRCPRNSADRQNPLRHPRRRGS